ncbi:BQ2448_7868 [Microbotryum intermedium]|uniref:BQ2448_7868 protein n=1 Tax=Microbotryum intermedium TaxID=269621 RepID=A0A238FPZ4_9BASI|nr:BQ2448_7868 [Microbotryum intermedium]
MQDQTFTTHVQRSTQSPSLGLPTRPTGSATRSTTAPASTMPPSSSSASASLSHTLNHSNHELPFTPSTRSQESDLDFCNAFWSSGLRKRTTNGTSEEAEDWGRQGVEVVWNRMKGGTKVLEDMRGWLKERSTIEDDYAKRILKLSKHPFGTGETAHLERAILQAKSELEVQSKAHQDFAAFLRQQDAQIADFVAKRESARKVSQATTEKTWKALANQRNHVLKAKVKYEEDAITINALHAQASLLQGRELDKVRRPESDAIARADRRTWRCRAQAQIKLDKAQQTVQVNERDYRNYVGVLKDTTRVWNEAWKNYCDISQDQEEERVDFVKCRVWDWANGISVVAMAEDDGAERLRTALEQCDAATDIKIFVQQSSTGKSIPDPLPFVDFSQKHTASKQMYKTANFKRSSTRIPGVQQTPLAVTDIGRAFQNAPEAIRNPPPARTQPAPIATATARAQSNETPTSATTMSPSTPDQTAIPSRASGDAALSSEPSRFAVSPSANLKSNAERPVSGSSAKAGHAPASAFQRSPSHTIESPMSPARYEGPGQAMSTSETKENLAPSGPSAYTRSTSQAQALSSQVHQRSASKPNVGPLDDYETDPILKALEKLHTSQSQAQQSGSPRSSADLGAKSPQSQSSLGRPSNAGPGPASSTSARPRSPSAMLMQPPPLGSQPRPSSRQSSHHPSATSARPRSPSATMMQPPPASSNGHSSRPSSRQSMNERSAQRHSVGPPPAAASQNNAGVGARGRSPSPQPFHPNALRPHSPSPNPQRSNSPQAGPQNGFIYSPQQQQQQQQPQPQHRGYAAHPPNPPSMVPASYSQHFGSQSNLGHAGTYSNPPSTVSSHHRVPSGPPSSSVGSSFGPPQPQPMYAARAPSPGPQAFSPVAGAISPPPSLQQAYMPQFQPPPPVPASHYGSLAQGYPTGYHSSPSVISIASPYSTVSSAPSQHFQSPPPPSVVASPSSYTQSPAFPSPSVNSPAQGTMDRKTSTHSGVSSISHASMYAAPQQQGVHPAQQQQQGMYPQQQHPQSMSSVSSGRPNPTGQVTSDGRPIEFYVNALHDYTATMAEEFSFRAGDVIAVTKTEPDGWWQGVRMGGEGQGLFPSNFVEMRT